jgi:hypothetical protein
MLWGADARQTGAVVGLFRVEEQGISDVKIKQMLVA